MNIYLLESNRLIWRGEYVVRSYGSSGLHLLVSVRNAISVTNEPC